MIIPPGPYRLEIDGELFGKFKTLACLKVAITKYRKKEPGDKRAFKAFDAKGHLLICQDDKGFTSYMPKPRMEATTFTDAKPILVQAVA